MTLEKAIEIGEDLLTDLPQFNPDDRREAVNLLIKAGKFVEADRVKYPYVKVPLLPGETED